MVINVSFLFLANRSYLMFEQNTSVGSNFKPTLNENKTFAFMGTDTDGNVLNFQARVGTQDAARQIVERLKKEVESFQ